LKEHNTNSAPEAETAAGKIIFQTGTACRNRQFNDNTSYPNPMA